MPFLFAIPCCTLSAAGVSVVPWVSLDTVRHNGKCTAQSRLRFRVPGGVYFCLVLLPIPDRVARMPQACLALVAPGKASHLGASSKREFCTSVAHLLWPSAVAYVGVSV